MLYTVIPSHKVHIYPCSACGATNSYCLSLFFRKKYSVLYFRMVLKCLIRNGVAIADGITEEITDADTAKNSVKTTLSSGFLQKKQSRRIIKYILKQ